MNDFPKLDNAKERICQIYSYQIGHSSLDMKVFSNETGKNQIIQFIDVRYIEGPTTWMGAEFTSKTAKESFQFALSLGLRGINLGDFILYEAKVNQRIIRTPYNLIARLYKAYLSISSVLPFSSHRQVYVRILARSCVLITKSNEENL